MNRAHAHQHHHHGTTLNRAFRLGVVLNLVYVAAEITAGLWSGSLALLTDAGHNFIDVLALLLAWGASWLSQRETSERRTYGYSRATILASLLSALLLLVAVGAIAWEAVARFMEPQSPPAMVLIVVAGVGVIINTATAMLFMDSQHNDLNVRGAFLHMAADAAVSLGVVLAGVFLLLGGPLWIDPAMSLLIGAVILVSTWGLLRDSLNLATDAVPKEVDYQAVRDYLTGLPGVRELHDLHIWAMSTTDTALTAHLVIPGHVHDDQNGDSFLFGVNDVLKKRFQIHHSTIQIERGSRDDCGSCD